MITEIVTFNVPDGLSREDVVAGFEATAPTWKENPDLIRKNYLYDPDTNTGGGVYLWKTRADADRWHGEAFTKRIVEKYGNAPRRVFYETPVVVDNVAGAIVTD